MKRMLINSCAALCLLAAGTAMAGDKAAMIASAMSAGPASVTDDATVKDHEGNVLKQGSNGYTCYPEAPTMGAACNQGQWDELIGALMANGEGGALGTSNSDPYQTDPGAVDDWVKEGPHMMIIVPREMLKGMSHNPKLKGMSHNPKDPIYVMWGDTPYAHIMVRIAEEE